MYTLEEMENYMMNGCRRPHSFLCTIQYLRKRHYLMKIMKHSAKIGYGGVVVRPNLINMGDVYELYEKGFDVKNMKDNHIHIRWY